MTGTSKIVLIRGLPGSGKSTMARTAINVLFAGEINGEKLVHIEADDYFMLDGVYCFDMAKIRDAHKWTKWRAAKLIENGRIPIVANTFSRIWEMQSYIDMADKHLVFKTTKEFKNIHGVGDEVIERMRERWEDYEGEEVL